MLLEGNLEYALARVHARDAARPSAAEWRRVESSRDLPHFLDVLRSSSLAPWTTTLDGTADTHLIERTLRSEWRRYVADVASWHPRRWQAWIGWVSWLPELPLLGSLGRRETAPAWLLADPLWGAVALAHPEQRSEALLRTPLAPLAAGLSRSIPLTALWHEQWQRLVPRTDADTGARLRTFMGLLDRFAAALVVADNSNAARDALAAGMGRLFRAAPASAVNSMCHLALLALDLERLRGDLVIRRLFPSAASGQFQAKDAL